MLKRSGCNQSIARMEARRHRMLFDQGHGAVRDVRGDREHLYAQVAHESAGGGELLGVA